MVGPGTPVWSVRDASLVGPGHCCLGVWCCKVSPYGRLMFPLRRWGRVNPLTSQLSDWLAEVKNTNRPRNRFTFNLNADNRQNVTSNIPPTWIFYAFVCVILRLCVCWGRGSGCVCVCACVCARARARACVCVCVCS